MTDPTILAYLAGVFDSDGYISVQRTREAERAALREVLVRIAEMDLDSGELEFSVAIERASAALAQKEGE